MNIRRFWKRRPASAIERLGRVFTITLLVVAVMISRVEASQNNPLAYKVGLISEISGIQDNAFNQMAYEGLQKAETDYGITGMVYTPATEADYGPKIQECISGGNDLCIAVGFLFTDLIETAAQNNPGVKFAIIDVTYDSYPANLRGMEFAVDEAGYLAGVLSARMSNNNVLGVIGGMKIPPVDRFISGFRQGAICTNKFIKTIIEYTGNFIDPDLGEEYALRQIDQGADLIFAVAGPTGFGSVLATANAQKWAIGVDADFYYSVFDGGSVQGAEYLLTSVMKRVDNAVYGTISDLVNSIFTSGSVLYDLENDGVSLAPFHEADPAVSQSIRDELALTRAAIIAGNIEVNSPCPGQPQVGLVADTSGFQDEGVNGLAYEGLWRGQNELGAFIRSYEPVIADDIPGLLQQCVDDGNGLCIGGGYIDRDAFKNAANANPGVKFAIVDHSYDSYPANLRGMMFAAYESGYLAGVLSASMPGVDKLGAVGGMQIPPVDQFIDGFEQGAQCVNPDIETLVAYINNFSDPSKGFQAAQTQISAGADVIFPVAGGASYGAVEAAVQAKVWTLGVDIDFYYTAFDGGKKPGAEYLLSSALKRIDNAVFGTILDLKQGAFSSGDKLYSLKNGGTGLAPFHDAEASIPTGVAAYLKLLEQDFIDGKITPSSPCRYYQFAAALKK